jgi:flagellar biosynthetic protein FliR
MIKIGLGGLLTMVLLDWQPLPAGTQSLTTASFGLAIGREILIGTIAGFSATLTFAAFQMAGDLMGLGSGFASAYIFNPTFESSGSPLENLFVLTATLLFLVINAHHAFLLGIAQTFEILPPSAPLPKLSANNLIQMTSHLIATGVQIALPILGCILLADITLGLLARVSPQIHVFFLGLPIKIGLGIMILALSMDFIFPNIIQLFKDMPMRSLMLFGY